MVAVNDQSEIAEALVGLAALRVVSPLAGGGDERSAELGAHTRAALERLPPRAAPSPRPSPPQSCCWTRWPRSWWRRRWR